MKFFLSLLSNSPVILVLAIVCSLVSGFANASLITLINRALGAGTTVAMQMGWSFAGLAIFSLVTALTSQFLLSHIYRQAIFNLRIKLSRQIVNAPLRTLETIGNARLFAVLIDDFSAIGGSLMPLLSLCSDIVITSVCLAYLCWLSWQMFLGMLAFLILGGTVYQVLRKKAEKTIRFAREEISVLYDHYHTLADGIKELKLHRHRRTAFFYEMLQPTAASIQKKFFNWDVLYSLASTWGRFLILFTTGLLLFILPSLIKINVHILTGYILTLLYIRSMLLSIMSGLPALSVANVAFQKIEALGLNLVDQSHDHISMIEAETEFSFQHLELMAVTHSYYRELEESDFTIGPINLSFSPGELIFLIGGNGSGKTTFAKLLTGLYTPKTGEIYLDGKLITDENRDWYRQHFSVVFAEFYLFDSLLGLNNINLDEQSQQYLVELQLAHKVKIKDGVLSTTALSSGQRKRLALLTAYLEDRPFYIFDEWASNQDPLFKEIFYTQILPNLQAKGKTILVITHDDKYFNLASRIIKLDYGQFI